MNTPIISAESLATLTDMIRDHVVLEQELGLKTIECNPAVIKALSRQPEIVSSAQSERLSLSASLPAAPTPPKEKKESPMKKPKASIPQQPLIAFSNLEHVHLSIAACTRCQLHQWRTQTVPGQGNTNSPDIMFIGEGPGKDEDIQGIPFVGRAGDVLTRLLKRMGYVREDIFIGNIVKCRPTLENEGKRDRPPTYEEMQGCLPYLKAQISFIKPKTLVLMGNTAVFGLFGEKGITKLRGNWKSYEGIPVMPTFHPSYLLRNGESSTQPFWDVWDDMSQVLKRLGKPVPVLKRD